jgi:dienelactone hydrolase
LKRRDGETAEQKTKRIEAAIASRVPDTRVLLKHMLGLGVDSTRVGIVGHSFGGWTALAAPDVLAEIRAVVALAPGGASKRRPGIIPTTLEFAWGRDVPTLYIVAEDDCSLPLAGMFELYERTPSTKQMAILRRADHAHFMDKGAELHEGFRAMPAEGLLADIINDMKPMSELCAMPVAHLFTKGLTLCHMDAMLKGNEDAMRYWSGDLDNELKARGIEGEYTDKTGVRS